MHPGLNRLLYLRLRAGARSQWRRLSTLRGLIGFAMGLSIVGVAWMSRSVSVELQSSWRQVLGSFSLVWGEDLLASIFAILCLLTLVVSSGPAIYFSPAESNFLFCGPFTRRQLLVYKFLSYFSGLMITGGLIALLTQRQSSFLTAFLGTLNAMLFIQLLTAAVSLIDMKLRQQGLRYFRQGFVILASGIAWACFAEWYYDESGGLGWLGGICISPFRIFAATFLATNWDSASVTALVLAITMNLGMVAGMIALDVDFREEVIGRSQKLHQRWVRANRSGVWRDQKAGRWRIPFFAGKTPVGILIWRQTTVALRTYRGTLLKLVAVSMGWGLLVSFLPRDLLTVTWGLSVWLCLFLLPKAIGFDFRSDWDMIPFLRTLPVHPVKLVFAQLVTPVLFVSVIEFLGLLVTCLVSPPESRIVLLSLMSLLLPLNFGIYAADNLLFLLFPAPLTPIGRLDFEFFGRSLIELFVRSWVVSVVMGVSLAVGLVARELGGNFYGPAVLTCWLSACVMTLMMLPLLAWAFKKFPLTGSA